MQMREKCLAKIIPFMDSNNATLRSKALKTLQDVVIMNPTLLHSRFIHDAIVSRAMDESTSVRDASVDFLSKIMHVNPNDASAVILYYPILSDRILDIGINVRKRTLKLLKDILLTFSLSEDVAIRDILPDMVLKILSRLQDEEENVQVIL